MTQTAAPPAREAREHPDVRPPPRRPSLARIAVAAVLSVSLVVAGAAAAYLFSTGRDEIYAARAEVVYQVSAESENQAQRAITTQQVMLSSRPRLESVADQVGIPVEELEESLSVEVVEDSEVIRAEATNTDPDAARQIVSRLVQGYVDDVGATASQDVDEQRAVLEQRLSRIVEELNNTEIRLQELSGQRREAIANARQQALELAQNEDVNVPTRLFDPDVVAPVTAEQELLESKERDLRRRFGQVRSDLTDLEVDALRDRTAAESAAASASVITPAYVLDEPVSPQPLRAAAAGALVGLLVAGTGLGLTKLRP